MKPGFCLSRAAGRTYNETTQAASFLCRGTEKEAQRQFLLAWGGVFYRELLKSLGTQRANSLIGYWLIDWWLCLSRCCKSCLAVTLTHIKSIPCYYEIVLDAQTCWRHYFPPCTVPCFQKLGKALMHTCESLCLCTWKLCLSSLLLHMQALFCTLVLRATSWGSLQASCLRSQRLSANLTLSTHTGPCSCFLRRLWTWNAHTSTHVLGFQEGHRKRKKLLEEQFNFCKVSFLAWRIGLCVCVGRVWSWSQSRTGTIIHVCIYVCVFWNICSSLALFSLLYMTHPCCGCWTPKLKKRERPGYRLK